MVNKIENLEINPCTLGNLSLTNGEKTASLIVVLGKLVAAATAAKSLQSSRLCATPKMAAHQAPPSLDSPGKNNGVGCRFLLQRMKVKSESEITQSCLTLRYPMDCNLPGSSIHGLSQARVLEWGAIAFSNCFS